MKNKIFLTLLPLFFLIFSSQAAIFIPETTHTEPHSASIVSIDKPKPESRSIKKEKKSRKEKPDKVDNLAKWGFISSIAGFVSIFLLPVVTFALFPLAIGLSIAGLNSIKRNNTRGKGYAIAGLSIGSAGVLLLLFGFLLVLSFLSSMN